MKRLILKCYVTHPSLKPLGDFRVLRPMQIEMKCSHKASPLQWLPITRDPPPSKHSDKAEF